MSMFFLAQLLFFGLVILYGVGAVTAVVTTLRLFVSASPFANISVPQCPPPSVP